MNRRFALLPLTVAAGAAIAVGAGFAAGAGSSSAAQPHGTNAPVLQQPALVKPFVSYGDHAIYDLIPGGNFAPQTATWSLNGDAALVANSADASLSGTHGLSLASGASATSASFPGGDVHTVRFYAENLGSSSSTLNVSATVDENGIQTQVPLGTVEGSSLAPTPVITLPESLQVALTKSDAPLRVTISSTGPNSHWLVKDVYVDPYIRCGSDC
jgi:hypothetical protein